LLLIYIKFILPFIRPICRKDNANERNESLLSNCRVQLILCKDNANERNESLLSNCRVQLILCKVKQYYRINKN
ncbi:MAG: hypothetical protein U0K50_08795, partial [Segatella copri]|nr:hypothetical protein [Segatella copri]